MKSIVIAITGASGAIYGVRLLEILQEKNVTVHLTASPAAEITLRLETGSTIKRLAKLAAKYYDVNDLAAPIASGSFQVQGMVIVPCSTRTLAAVANGISDNLITRAADVCLKEKRPLVIVPRETPLNQIQLRNMLTLAQAGTIILPASPAFYHKPTDINQLVDHVVGKILDAIGIEHSLFKRWQGLELALKS
ncbi:MAG: UbiX family flavin prenyltransferase [Candidatus Bathyarchaeia archaeon]